MRTEIQGNPAFGRVHIDLDPGETVIAEAGSMQSMSTGIELQARLNGRFFSAYLNRREKVR